MKIINAKILVCSNNLLTVATILHDDYKDFLIILDDILHLS
jgi:hypothetical protein